MINFYSTFAIIHKLACYGTAEYGQFRLEFQLYIMKLTSSKYICINICNEVTSVEDDSYGACH